MTTSLDSLYYLIEYLYLRAQIAPAPTEAILTWKSHFDRFLDEANLAYCRRLLSVIKRTDLTLTKFGHGIVKLCEGALFDFEGNIEDASKSYETCLSDFKNAEISIVEQQRWVSDLLGRLATIQKKLGNFAKANRFYNMQFDIYRKSEGSKRKMAGVLSELAAVALAQDDYENARKWLENHLEIALELGFLGDQLDVLIKLIPLYQKAGDSNKADRLCEAAVLLAEELHNQSAVITSLGLSASIRVERKQYEDAYKIYKVALAKSLEAGNQIKVKEMQEQLDKLEQKMAKELFISYSSKDREFVERLANDLKGLGIKVWWDQWEVRVGDSIIQKVGDGINQSAYLAAVLSPHSVKSDWVQRELGSALMKQLSAERGIRVLPLLISDCEIPILIREIKWADFRTDYENGLKELLQTIGQK